MADFVFQIPSRVLFGPGCIRKAGNEASLFGRRILMITESVLNEWKIPEKVQEILKEADCDCMIHDDLETHSTSKQVDHGVNLVQKGKVQAVMGIGGVRALSIAKCVAKLGASPSSIDDHLEGLEFSEGGVPYIEVPTTCRNPYSLTGEAMIIDARTRLAAVLAPGNPPDLVLIDPELTLTISAKYTAMTMLDTFLHSMEGLVSKKSSFLSDSLFLRSLRCIISSINQSTGEPDNLKYREQASQAGLLAGVGLTISRSGIGSALSHAISGRFQIPQSWVASILLPRMLEWNLSACPEKIARVYDVLDQHSTSYGLPANPDDIVGKAGLAVEGIRRLVASLRLPLRLADLGLKLEDVYSVAETAKCFPGVKHMPAPVTTEDIYRIIQQVY